MSDSLLGFALPRSVCSGPRLSAIALILCLASAGPAAADQIYGTGEGCVQFLCFGFDVSTSQAVGVRFTPTSDYNLDEMGFWFMNNDFSGQIFGDVDVTVEGDLTLDGCSTPDGVTLDATSFAITAVGFEPELDTVLSPGRPLLQAGTPYWIVARSDSVPGQNPVWVAADGFNGFSAFTEFGNLDSWQCGGDGAIAGVLVGGTRAGSDYALAVSNLVAGEEATISVTGAEPNTTTYVALSTSGLGETFVAPLNVTLELADPFQRVAPIATDGNGDGSFALDVPPDAGGRAVWLQSVQFDRRSDVVAATVE